MFCENMGIALTDGAIDHTGLAEPTTPSTATHDFSDDPIVDHLYVRNDKLLGIGKMIKVFDHPFLDLPGHTWVAGLQGYEPTIIIVERVIKTGNIDSIYTR